VLVTPQQRVNEELWSRPGLVRGYANRLLRPVEVLLLVRFRDALGERVLELGCGAGRLTGYLAAIAPDVLGTDVSPAMIAESRRRYPGTRFEVLDLRDLSGLADGGFDTVVAGYNLLDVLDDGERRRTLADVARVLAARGLLLMSSHNEAAAARRRGPWRVGARNPARVAVNVARLPRRVRNRARIRPLEHRAADHSVLNDEAHDFQNLHYYVTPDAQRRQLGRLGYEVVGCYDLEGAAVEPGDPAAHSEEIHYVARAGAALTTPS
jgi:SAM-dependent methyltransferase